MQSAASSFCSVKTKASSNISFGNSLSVGKPIWSNLYIIFPLHDSRVLNSIVFQDNLIFVHISTGNDGAIFKKLSNGVLLKCVVILSPASPVLHDNSFAS